MKENSEQCSETCVWVYFLIKSFKIYHNFIRYIFLLTNLINSTIGMIKSDKVMQIESSKRFKGVFWKAFDKAGMYITDKVKIKEINVVKIRYKLWCGILKIDWEVERKFIEWSISVKDKVKNAIVEAWEFWVNVKLFVLI